MGGGGTGAELPEAGGRGAKRVEGGCAGAYMQVAGGSVCLSRPAGSRRRLRSDVWGLMQERAPVCLCIYEPHGGRGRRGGQPPAAVPGHVEPRSGQAACPFPWAGLMEPEFQVGAETARPRPPGSRGHSLPSAHLPSPPREGGIASCPSPPALGSCPALTGPSGHWVGRVWGRGRL